jgi:two-component system, LytTR family, sensor kinase
MPWHIAVLCPAHPKLLAHLLEINRLGIVGISITIPHGLSMAESRLIGAPSRAAVDHANPGALPSRSHSPLITLAVLWATLWTVISISDITGYLHDPSIPVWQPLVLLSVSTCTIAIWLWFELGSARYLGTPLDPARPWFQHHLRRLPLLAVGYVVIVFGLRHGLFALAGARYQHVTWRILGPFEFVKVSLFYCLWLGLVYGTLSQIRSREQSAQLILVQKALAEAQLARLRAQLRPHFLFNTLNTVSSLMHSDVGRADRLLTRLGDLLRASLGAGETDTVPLREELRLLRLYSEIMEERFSGRVTTDWHIAEDTLPIRVPAMLLQPLLENAFKYGVEQTTGAQHIRIVASRDQDRLYLKIHNTGSALHPGWREGIGLANCRERLRVLHGNAATVDISNDRTTGVETSISLPLDIART